MHIFMQKENILQKYTPANIHCHIMRRIHPTDLITKKPFFIKNFIHLSCGNSLNRWHVYIFVTFFHLYPSHYPHLYQILIPIPKERLYTLLNFMCFDINIFIKHNVAFRPVYWISYTYLCVIFIHLCGKCMQM